MIGIAIQEGRWGTRCRDITAKIGGEKQMDSRARRNKGGRRSGKGPAAVPAPPKDDSEATRVNQATRVSEAQIRKIWDAAHD